MSQVRLATETMHKYGTKAGKTSDVHLVLPHLWVISVRQLCSETLLSRSEHSGLTASASIKICSLPSLGIQLGRLQANSGVSLGIGSKLLTTAAKAFALCVTPWPVHAMQATENVIFIKALQQFPCSNMYNAGTDSKLWAAVAEMPEHSQVFVCTSYVG